MVGIGVMARRTQALIGGICRLACMALAVAGILSSYVMSPPAAAALPTSTNLSWKQIAGGHDNSCAIASDDQVYCWGANANGQAGNNTTNSSLVPVPVDTSGVLAGKAIRSIAVAPYHVCAIASDDKVYCWGFNNFSWVMEPTRSRSYRWP